MMTLEEIRAPSRLPRVVSLRRQIASALRQQGWTYRQIGALLNRTHSTIISYGHREGWEVEGNHQPAEVLRRDWTP